AALDRHFHGLPRADGHGAARHRDRPPRVPVAAQPARHQGRRRRGRDLAARRHRQRGGGRAESLPRPRHPHAARAAGGARPPRGDAEGMRPVPFDYVAASSAADAVEALRRYGDEAKVLAGGQSLIPMLALRLARPSALVDINGCGDLDGLAESDGTLTVGALVRQRDLERWAATRLPLFAHALSLVAHAPIRNRGTVVGNLVHADPASELPALLLCLDGAIMARRKGGERVVPADKVYLAPLTTSLESDEVATAARFALPPEGTG